MTQVTTTADTYRDRSGLITGSLAVVVGVVVIIYAAGMPEIREGIPGPGLFPTMIGGFLVLFGTALALFSWFRGKRPETPLEALLETEPADDHVETLGTTEGALATSQRSATVNALAFVVAIAFYIVAAEFLGFMLTMAVLTIGLMLLLRVKPLRAVVIGLIATIALWALFEKLLLVQLPNGFLGIF